MMVNMFFVNWLKKFKTVYCEDCSNSFFSKGELHCRAFSVETDITGMNHFVKKREKIIVNSFLECERVRKTKEYPIPSYRSYCFKFLPKK